MVSLTKTVLILLVDQHRSCCGARQPFRSLTRDLISSVSLQFFSIILIIFVAEVAAGVVALAYSSFVSPPSVGWPEVIASPLHLLHFLFRNTDAEAFYMQSSTVTHVTPTRAHVCARVGITHMCVMPQNHCRDFR